MTSMANGAHAQPQTPTLEATSQARRSTSLGRILTIARNAFREAVRDRVLYNLVIFVLLLIGGAIFLGELSDEESADLSQRRMLVERARPFLEEILSDA